MRKANRLTNNPKIQRCSPIPQLNQQRAELRQDRPEPVSREAKATHRTEEETPTTRLKPCGLPQINIQL
ncbi:MAG: hypothetical protein MH252_07700 [Thermosynechococcaceae cyanobacterium MS004]|nr:hypothetical protein [Thermosynechococcaceae cyanobacterium MS004]